MNLSRMGFMFGEMGFMFDEMCISTSDELLQKYINYLANNPPTLPHCMKNNDRAIEYKIMGDEEMKHDLYRDALITYTKALSFVHPYSMISGDCFAERSLILLKLGDYKESLSDVNLALQLPISEKTKLELIKRKERLTKDINHEKPKETAIKSSKIESTLTLAYGESEEIVGASSAIGIAYNDTFGRHIVATKPIKAGDVLLIQQPFTHIIALPLCEELDDNAYICNNCLNLTKAPIPCDWCLTTFYCSNKCRLGASQSHREVECRLPSFERRGYTRFMQILKTVTKDGTCLEEVKLYLEDILNCQDKRKAGFVDDKLVGTDVRAFLSLIYQNNEKQDLKHVPEMALLAVLLRNKTNFLRSSNDVLGLAKLMVHLCDIQKNFQVDVEKTSKYGIYPVFHLLKHSCVSNTICYSPSDNCKVLRACTDIKPGEQIFFNYLDLRILIRDAALRRLVLKENKNYICKCIACKRNYDFKRKIRRLEIPDQLRSTLIQEPTSIEGMWELLSLLYRKISHPCPEIELIKRALEDVYEGRETEHLMAVYCSLGIF